MKRPSEGDVAWSVRDTVVEPLVDIELDARVVEFDAMPATALASLLGEFGVCDVDTADVLEDGSRRCFSVVMVSAAGRGSPIPLQLCVPRQGQSTAGSPAPRLPGPAPAVRATICPNSGRLPSHADFNSADPSLWMYVCGLSERSRSAAGAFGPQDTVAFNALEIWYKPYIHFLREPALG